MKDFVVIKNVDNQMYLSIIGWNEDKAEATMFKLEDAKNLILNEKIKFESVFNWLSLILC